MTSEQNGQPDMVQQRLLELNAGKVMEMNGKLVPSLTCNEMCKQRDVESSLSY